MEVRHDNEADKGSDYAKEFDAIIGCDAGCDIIGNTLIFNSDKGAANQNNCTKNKPTDTKIPFHYSIIARRFDYLLLDFLGKKV